MSTPEPPQEPMEAAAADETRDNDSVGSMDSVDSRESVDSFRTSVGSDAVAKGYELCCAGGALGREAWRKCWGNAPRFRS